MVYNNKSLELKDIYMAFALNIYLRAERFAVEPGTKHNVINAVFPHLSSKFEGCLVARTKLSKNLHKHIGFGEFVTMDEKQRKWRGASKCIKKVLAKKNDPIGHWITQACVSLQESSRSFIFGLYLFMGTSSEGKSVETKEKVWTWLIDLMQPTTRYLIVCCDCFYLDNSAQALLNEQGVPFHCSVKAAWYKFASAHLGAKLDQMDTWAGMANKNTGEVAVMTWNSEKNVGKKLLLSTSLKKVPGKQRTTNPPGWILYKTIFKHCQNRIMFKQFFQAEALGICQLDSCHLGSLNEIIAVLLMATKFGVTVLVMPHASGVGLCEYVQHIIFFDYVYCCGSTEERWAEFVDHLHEHFVHPCVVKNGCYMPPQDPGYSTQMHAASIEEYSFPDGPVWKTKLQSH